MDDTYKQVTDLYNDLAAISEQGSEAQVEEFIKERFSQLPEEVKGELLARMYLESVAQRVEEEDTIAAIQERGLEALDELDAEGKQGSEESRSYSQT